MNVRSASIFLAGEWVFFSLVIFVFDLRRKEVLHVAEVFDLVSDDQGDVWRDLKNDLARERGRLREEVQVPKGMIE